MPVNSTFQAVKKQLHEKRNASAEARVLVMAQGNTEEELIALASRAIAAAMLKKRARLSQRG